MCYICWECVWWYACVAVCVCVRPVLDVGIECGGMWWCVAVCVCVRHVLEVVEVCVGMW